MKEIFLMFIFSAFASTQSTGEKVVQYQCGACHTRGLLTAQEGALSVFDLKNSKWKSELSIEQSQTLVQRLRERITMTDNEISYLIPKGAPIPRRPTLDEVNSVELMFIENQVKLKSEPNAAQHPFLPLEK